MGLASKGGSSSASALDKGQNRSGIKPMETKSADGGCVCEAKNHGGGPANKRLPR